VNQEKCLKSEELFLLFNENSSLPPITLAELQSIPTTTRRAIAEQIANSKKMLSAQSACVADQLYTALMFDKPFETDQHAALAGVLKHVSPWLLADVMQGFDHSKESIWICYVKAARRVWAALHYMVAPLANNQLELIKGKDELDNTKINKIMTNQLVKDFQKEKQVKIQQLDQYSEGTLLDSHYTTLKKAKEGVFAQLNEFISSLMNYAGFAKVVSMRPTLDSKNFMKSLNSLRSKMEREDLSDEQCYILFLRDLFRFRIFLDSGTVDNVILAIQAL